MTVRLSVDRQRWTNHVTSTLAEYPAPVPVVKGNGYGFGRDHLAAIAAQQCTTIAVGTVHELGSVPTGVTAVVLTPSLIAPDSSAPILTVGAPEHIAPLRGWSGRVLVKLASSMHRYGAGHELIDIARDAGLDVVGVSIHPPLQTDDNDHADDICDLVADVDPSLEVWVSHVATTIAERLHGRQVRHRIGTRLWHGDRDALHLSAQVIDVRPITAGSTVGYRQTTVTTDGHLVMVGAGSAHGVAPLSDGRSPFHHQRTRLDMVELPHMHTTMLHVPTGGVVPHIGEWLDLQRPLTQTYVDIIDWN